jgi:ABC-type Zn uptake system ZnuABC Zn-binding protein ZnuA
MKRLFEGLIRKFAYKNPQLWIQIVEDIDIILQECRKKEKERMKRNLQKLLRKIK